MWIIKNTVSSFIIAVFFYCVGFWVMMLGVRICGNTGI